MSHPDHRPDERTAWVRSEPMHSAQFEGGRAHLCSRRPEVTVGGVKASVLGLYDLYRTLVVRRTSALRFPEAGVLVVLVRSDAWTCRARYAAESTWYRPAMPFASVRTESYLRWDWNMHRRVTVQRPVQETLCATKLTPSARLRARTSFLSCLHGHSIADNRSKTTLPRVATKTTISL